MSENKKIIKNSFILYGRLIIVSFISLFSARFILQALGASDYGLYNVVGGLVFIMAFLNNVMVSTSYRFIAFELGLENEGNVRKVFNTSLAIHLAIGCLVILIAETIGIYYIKHYFNVAPNRLDDAVFVFRLSVISTVFSIFSVPYQGLITAKEKFSVNAAIDIFRSLLAFGIVILLFYYDGNRLRLYAELITALSIIPPFLYFIYCQKYFSSICRWDFQKDLSTYREMGHFSIWIFVGASVIAAELQGSVLLINVFFGTRPARRPKAHGCWRTRSAPLGAMQKTRPRRGSA